jgi:hypothetical protein
MAKLSAIRRITLNILTMKIKSPCIKKHEMIVNYMNGACGEVINFILRPAKPAY